MLRLRYLRWVLIAFSIAWSLFFLDVLQKQASPNQSPRSTIDAADAPSVLTYTTLPAKNEWAKRINNDASSLKAAPIAKDPAIKSQRPLLADTITTTTATSTDTANERFSYCETPPGEAPEENDRMGYQVLRRMQYFLKEMNNAKRHAEDQGEPRILCLLVDFSETMKQAVLDTYGRDCDSVLMSPPPTSTSFSAWTLLETSTNKTSVLEIGVAVDNDYQQLFRFIHDNLNYTWVHWATPDRYLLPEFLRFLLREVPADSDYSSQAAAAAAVMESWVMDKPGRSAYTGLFGEKHSRGCDAPRTMNLQAVSILAHNCSRLKETAATANGTVWMERCLGMHNQTCKRTPERQFRGAPWLYLKRFYEIQLPAAATTNVASRDSAWASSLHRYHGILHGHCDRGWDKPYGALDKNGMPGYLHDPTFLKRNPLPFTYHVHGEKEGVCDIAPGMGEEGQAGYRGLKKIRIHSQTDDSTPRKRVLCMVYTHSSGHDRLRAVAETWGARCDGFLAASDQTDETIGAVNLLHEGPEEYQNMWLKVHAMWQYVYDHYADDFDLFHIGGDDHYVIPENLRHTAATGSWKGPWNDSEPLYLGGSLPLGKKRRYCNGGSGYTLNRVAVKLLVKELFPTPRCWPHWKAPDEDKIVASCFREIGLQCMDTNDHRNETRYHTWHVDQHADWSIGKPAQGWSKLVEYHGIAWKEGLGQISDSSVSFHLKKKQVATVDSGLRRYHAILHNLCSNETKLMSGS